MTEVPPPVKMMFDRPTLKRLIVAHDKALKNGDDSFIFDGQKFLTRYAYYLIQFLQSQIELK